MNTCNRYLNPFRAIFQPHLMRIDVPDQPHLRRNYFLVHVKSLFVQHNVALFVLALCDIVALC